jgi:hypothetical protein
MSRIRFRRLGTAVIVRAFGAAPWLAVVISGLSPAPCAAAAQAPVSTMTASSRELLAMPAADLMRLLDDTRPRPISEERRAQVLGSLPTEGEVTGLDSGHREKLVALLPVLRTARRDNVYAIKVVAVRQAFVGLHARTVLLVSDRAIALLDTAELQALAAHEIGHEYVWDAYERAAQRRDTRSLRDLELVCDIVATVTLRSLRMDATSLISGLEKMSAFNRRELGAASNESSYPTLDVRRAAVIDLARRLRAEHDGANHGAPVRAERHISLRFLPQWSGSRGDTLTSQSRRRLVRRVGLDEDLCRGDMATWNRACTGSRRSAALDVWARERHRNSPAARPLQATA